MASIRIVAVAGVCALSLVLGCQKKEEAPVAPIAIADAAVVTAVDAAPSVAATSDPLPVQAKAAQPTAVAPAADAGPTAMDAGVATADAGTSGGPQDCCCEVAGQPLVTIGMSECNKARKGQCVKKDRCAAAPAPAEPAKDSCCCDAAGKKEVVGMSECNKTRKGQCVKMTDCKK